MNTIRKVDLIEASLKEQITEALSNDDISEEDLSDLIEELLFLQSHRELY